ncbi:MAG: LamG domain-containing protein [Bacteroidales bacterium]
MKNKFGLFGVLFGTLVLSGLLMTSCSKDDDDEDDGKIDPNTIATSSLIAYFSFETEGEAVQYANNTITFNQKVGAATITAGRRGNAYQGSTTEAYFEYNVAAGTALKTLDEFTMACWIKTPHTTDGAAKIFAVNGGDGFMGNLTLMQESQAEGDSVDMKFFLYDSESPDWKGHDIRKQSVKFLNDMWYHVVAVYNKTTSAMELYANGTLVLTSIRYAGPDPGDGSDQPLLGPIKLGQDMTKIHFGAWPQQVAGTPEGWMTYYRGMVDEFRIYKKALTADEIMDLYEAEVTQIE